jgi:hypothetical protein
VSSLSLSTIFFLSKAAFAITLPDEISLVHTASFANSFPLIAESYLLCYEEMCWIVWRQQRSIVMERAEIKFLIIKPTTCTNFSNLFLEWHATYFGQFLCPSSGILHCTHSNGMCHTGLLTAVSKHVWHIPIALCTVKKLLMMDRENVRNKLRFIPWINLRN